MEMLKQHLPLSNIGVLEFCGQHHLQAWLIKAERDNLSQEEVTGILKVPAHFTGGGRSNTQIIPATRNHGHQHDGKEKNALADYLRWISGVIVLIAIDCVELSLKFIAIG